MDGLEARNGAGMSVQAASAPPLGFATKALYGFGSIAYGVKDAAFRTYLLLFYNQVVGIPAAIVSAAIMAALVIDAVIDPIVGQMSDNLRTKLGRRHPFMYGSAIPIALSFLLLFDPPEGLSGVTAFLYIAGVSFLVRTFITFYEIPSSALAPELTQKYDERAVVASYRYFFAYFGGVGMSFAMLYLFLRPTAEQPVGQLNPAGYHLFGVVGAVVILASVLISSMGTHSRIKYLRALPPPAKQSVFATFAQMGQTFAHKDFLSVLAFGICKFTAIGVFAATALYFGTFMFGFAPRQLAVLTLEGMVAALLAMAVAPWAARTFGKRNAAFILSCVAVVFAVMPVSLRLAGVFWENGHPYLLPTIFAMQGVYALCGISSAILVHAMIGDIVDESTLRTGRRAEGLFYAANSLIQKCASGLGVLVAGLVLTAASFPEHARPGQVTPELMATLAYYFIPTLAVLYIGGALFLSFYRIDRASHEANLARLREREAGAASLGD